MSVSLSGGTIHELDSLREQMATARTLNKSARGSLLAMDAATDPMDVLRTVVSAQGAAKTLTAELRDAGRHRSLMVSLWYPGRARRCATRVPPTCPLVFGRSLSGSGSARRS